MSVLAAALVLVGCGSTPAGPGTDQPAPRQGVILFRDPTPRTGSREGRTQKPLTFEFRADPTRDKNLSPLDANTRVGSLAERRAQALRHPKVAESIPNFLHPEDFAELWTSLVEAGIFLLPEYGSRLPPKDRAHILLDDGAGRRHIFPKPMPEELAGYPPEELKQILPVWGRCKLLLASQASR